MSEIVSGEIMYSLAETICLAVDADKFNLYLVEAEGEMTRHVPGAESRPVYQIGPGTTVAAYCAHTRNMMRVSLPVSLPAEEDMCPAGVPGMKGLAGKVLCHPICSSDGELEAIIELIRTTGNMFTDDDCEVSHRNKQTDIFVIADSQQLHHLGRVGSQLRQ